MKKTLAVATAFFVFVGAVTPPVAYAHEDSALSNPSSTRLGFFSFFSGFSSFLLPVSDSGTSDGDDSNQTVSFRSFITDGSLGEVRILVKNIVAEATRPLALFENVAAKANARAHIRAAEAITIRSDDDSNDEEDAVEHEVGDDLAAHFTISLATSSSPCVIPQNPFGGQPPFIHKDGKVKIISSGSTFIFKDGKHKIISTPSSYIEKNGKEKIIITPGAQIHKNGSLKSIVHCNGTATTTPPTPDTTAPAIASVQASAISPTSVRITWTTDEKATGRIFVGTSTPLSLTDAVTRFRPSLLKNHSFTVSDLTASTTYRFVVESKDAAGNTATSSEHSFTTGAAPDTAPPAISALSVSGVSSTTATVSWNTSEAATGKVYFGTSTPLSLSLAQTLGTSTLGTSHSFTLSPLASSTAYFAVVESKDAAGNTAFGSEISFTTGI